MIDFLKEEKSVIKKLIEFYDKNGQQKEIIKSIDTVQTSEELETYWKMLDSWMDY